jgi:hypothetical protein
MTSWKAKALLLLVTLVACAAPAVGTANPTAHQPTSPTNTPDATPTMTETPMPTATRTPEPTPTHEQIGGDKSVVLWLDLNQQTFEYDSTVPAEFAPYLTPTSPEQLESLPKIMLSDGTPIEWGGAVGYFNPEASGFGLQPIMPGLIRGVVEYGMFQEFPTYGVIIEFPVQNGSVFWISALRDYNYGVSTNAASRLVSGAYPTSCARGTVCTRDTIVPSLTDHNVYTDRDFVPFLRGLTGRMVLFNMNDVSDGYKSITDAIASGRLYNGILEDVLYTPSVWY